jgi:hypothetical protein
MKTIALLVLAAPLCAAAQSIAFRHAGDIAYACGGVGSDERRALDALRPEARLEMLLVTAKRGGYTAGAEVTVTPARGGAPATFTASGPTCLIQAPAGTYRVQGTFDGATRTANARVPATGKAARVVLAFPDEPGDDIRATEEEKAEARSP